MLKRRGHLQNKTRIPLPLIAILFIASSASAQIENDWDVATSRFESRVKSVDFFIDRFNNNKNPTGRAKAIFALFDQRSLNRKDLKVREKLIEFFTIVTDTLNPVFLNFEDPGWFAIVKFDCTLNDKSGDMDLYLQTLKDSTGVYTWNAKFVESTNLGFANSLSDLSFAPSAHGTDFMDIRLKLKEHPSSLLTDGAKKLSIAHIQKIDYEFFQVPGWKIIVSYFNRDDYNSGWLIRSIERITPGEKNDRLTSKNLE